MKHITLQKGREASILRQHPWIFSGGIAQVEEGTESGDVVRVISRDGQFVAIGHYQDSSLAVKVLSLKDEEINADWYANKIQAALELRKKLGFPNEQTDAYRLMHGEGDGVPGLIIDVYAGVAVIQPHALGVERHLSMIVEGLKGVGFEHIVHKPVDQRASEVMAGKVDGLITIQEHGYRLVVDVLNGQKTGFFLDQRDNRKLLEAYATGQRVLNAFSYTGGFSIAAATSGAVKVVSLDASAAALKLANENASLNGISEQHETVKADAVNYLQQLDQAFDVIVLDPPAFAKHKSARHAAVQAYKRINAAAFKHLPVGGILFTFSCSQVIDTEMFRNTVASAAIETGTAVQILQQLQQPADHPVNLCHPEGRYLKGLIVRKIGVI